MATQVTNYQCPACTGPLHFVGGSGKLECDYCGCTYSVQEIEALFAEKEKAAEAAMNTADKKAAAAAAADDSAGWNVENAGSAWDGKEAAGLRAYSCPSCAAEIICDETTAASSCLYCGNPTVVPGQLGGALKPDYVIPFKLNKEAAVKALQNYYKGKLFLPKTFSDSNHVEEIKGVYAPYWLFDGEANADITYKAQRVHSHRSGDYQVTVTEHYRVFRKGHIRFEKIPVDGSTKMPDAHMEAIEPFEYKDLTQFSTAYLPGFFADKYDIDAKASAERADTRTRTSARDTLAATVKGYSSVAVEREAIQLTKGDVKYALMPVWMLNTKWQDKMFTFAMNGQTGKLVGDLPVSRLKYWAWFAGIAVPLMAIITFITLR